MRSRISLSCLLGLCLTLTGCSGQGNRETEGQALARYRPRAAALVDKLHQVAAVLPKRLNPRSFSSPPRLDPPMNMSYGNNQNAWAMGEPQLLNVQTTPAFDAWSGDTIVLFLRWIDSTRNSPPSELRGNPLFTNQDAERVFATKYLVVLRVVDYTPPKAADPNDVKAGYSGGNATLHVFVVSLDSPKVLDGFSVSAATSKDVWVEYSKKDSSSEVAWQVEQAALRTMEADALNAIQKALKERLGCTGCVLE